MVWKHSGPLVGVPASTEPEENFCIDTPGSMAPIGHLSGLPQLLGVAIWIFVLGLSGL